MHKLNVLSWANELSTRLSGAVQSDVRLDRLTTYRIGGPARVVARPHSVDDVACTLRLAAEANVPLLVLGLGSNVLLDDSGFMGIVLRFGTELAALKQSATTPALWEASAGLPTPLLARRTANAGYGGVHRLIGVPGTVGGGIYMNAGAHGQDFSRVTKSVTVVTNDGEVQTLNGDEISWKYRDSQLGDHIVVGATLALTTEDREKLYEDVRRHFKWRRVGTPFEQPCCGSVFRNPHGDELKSGAELTTAGQLIHAAGMKSFRVGGAEVSTKHANYIVNLGGATARDVRSVIETVRSEVAKKFDIELELEVRIIDRNGNLEQ